MTKSYSEELVYIEAEDGLPLEGCVIRPVGRDPLPVPLVHVHGLTGKFYSKSVIQIGRELAGHGYTFISGNNRGHDAAYPYRRSPSEQPTPYGGSWELLSEAPHDISAWVGFAAGLGFRGVGLLGHSLGARKVVAYMADRQDPRVLGLVTASPPIKSVRPRPELIAQATEMVAAGRARDLLPWGISAAGFGTSSAEAYLDRFRSGWDLFGLETPDPPIARVRCPLLSFYGTDEQWVGGADELELIKTKARGAVRVETRVFEGADHSYTGQHVAVGQALAGWLETLI